MILVTGGTGMIGAHLLYLLAKEGHSVRALKRKGASSFLYERYLKNDSEVQDKVDWVEGDLLEPDTLESALTGVSVVFHCAALVSFLPKEALLMERVNIEGTANLVNLCLANEKIQYFAFVSSVATLGRINGDQQLDENAHWNPSTHPSNYAISKYGAEREVWRGIAEGLPGVIVNPSIVLGPGDFSKGSAALFKKVENGFPFYTEGISGFVDVRDVCKALYFLWKKNITAERFILNSEDLSFKVLFEKISLRLNTKAPYIKIQPWMTSLFWPLDALRCLITGGKPFITRETARSARSRYHYSAEKIKAIGFSFGSIDACIDFTIPYLKNRD